MKEFDYYVFIDYSESLIGYIIIEKSKIKEILSKTTKLRHYKKVRHDKKYLAAVKRDFENKEIEKLLFKCRIKKMIANIELFSEILEFLIKNKEKKMLVSVDDNFYIYLLKYISQIISRENLSIVRESKLKPYSIEYKLNLIIDNLLAIKRKNRKK